MIVTEDAGLPEGDRLGRPQLARRAIYETYGILLDLVGITDAEPGLQRTGRPAARNTNTQQVTYSLICEPLPKQQLNVTDSWLLVFGT